jgi:hypothetical protein
MNTTTLVALPQFARMNAVRADFVAEREVPPAG